MREKKLFLLMINAFRNLKKKEGQREFGTAI